MRFNTKLILAFALLLGIVIGIGVLSLRHVRADSEMEQAVDARWSKVEMSREAQAYSNLNSRIRVQVFLVDNAAEVERLLAQASANTEHISKLIETLRANVESIEEAQLLSSIENTRASYSKIYREALGLLVNDRKEDAARSLMMHQGLPLLVKYHDAWNTYSNFQSQQLDLMQSAGHARRMAIRWEAFLLVSIAVILSIAIVSFVIRNMTRHLSKRELAEEALRRARADLEARVQQRTAELASMNADLEKQIAETRMVEGALRRSEERYRQIVEWASDTIFRISPSGRFTFLNPSAAALVKRTVDECVGLHFTEIIRPDYRKQVIRFYRQQMKDHIPTTQFEFPTVAKDGSEVWISQNVQLVIKDGQVVELLGIARDITSRKEMEQRLLESERRYRLLFESNPMPMWVYDAQTLRFLAVNDAAVTHYGYARDEFLAMTIADIRPAEEVQSLMDQLAAGVPDSFEGQTWRHKKKDGTIIDVEITSHTLNLDGRRNRIVLAHDITDRKRAEEALAAERNLLRTLIDELPDRIYVKDAQSRFLLNNKGHIKAMGVESQEELLGKTDFDFRPAELAAQFYADDQKVIQSGQPLINRDEQLLSPLGELTSLLVTKVPLRDAHENTIGLIGISRDITERKSVEEQFRLQTARFKQLFANAPMGIVMVDVNEVVLDANDYFETMFGFSLNELQGLPLNKWIVPDGYRREGAELSAQTLKGDAVEKETLRQRKDGALIPVQIYGVPIVADDELVGVFAIYIDLTERKRSEENFRDLLETAPDAMVITNEKGEIVLVNKRAEELFGYRRDELLNQEVEMLMPQRFRQQHYVHREAFNADPKLRSVARGVELFGRRKDNSEFPVEVSLSPLKTTGGMLISSAIRDISERRRMDLERQVLFEIIQGANNTTDLDEFLKLVHEGIAKYLYAENCFVAFYDEATEMLHFPFWVDQLDPCPPPRPLGVGFSSYVLRTGKPILVGPELTEKMYQRGEVEKSGSTSASWLGVPLPTPSRIIGVLVVQHYQQENAYDDRDVEFLTSVGSQIALAIERKRAETSLREAEEQLRQAQKMESIGTLAGGIAHDFNNLMTAVTGYSELTLRALEPESPLRLKIEEIKKAGERAASLTRQLLAFGRKQILQPKVLDLNAIITGTSKMLSRMIGEDVELNIELDGSLGQVKADPGQIEQVLMNLVVNARDAMPGGGCVTIKTENVYLDSRLAKRQFVVEPGPYVMLSVTDTGCGMDEETKAHIFEPFFTTKEVGKGTGLGLSTVYGIVKQSGGSIWVYTEVGTGTAFKIYLPRCDDLVEIDQADEEVSLGPHGHETILLVEDEELVRDLTREVLEECGYIVITAPNGKEGLRICQEFQGQIDLMITDVVMPQMSGRELAENVATLRPETRILYMSGFTDDAILRQGKLDDGLSFIQKPFSPNLLALKTREMLDQRSGTLA